MKKITVCKLMLFFSCLYFLSACTHSAVISPSVSPVAYEMANDRVAASAAIYIYPELLDHSYQVHPSSYQCSAWKYNLEVGKSVSGTVSKVVEASFEKAYPVSRLQETPDLYDVIVSVGLMDCNCALSFHSSFFSGTADASAELSLKVVLLNNKLERIDQFVVGYSSRRTSGAGGFCEGGSTAIEAAFEQCLKHISIELAEKLSHNSKMIKILEAQKFEQSN